ARREEGRADPDVPAGPAAVSRDSGTARRADLPRAELVDGTARRDPRGDGAVHGGRAHRALLARGRRRRAPRVRRGRERAVPPRPGAAVPPPGEPPPRGPLAGALMPRRPRLRPRV